MVKNQVYKEPDFGLPKQFKGIWIRNIATKKELVYVRYPHLVIARACIHCLTLVLGVHYFASNFFKPVFTSKIGHKVFDNL